MTRRRSRGQHGAVAVLTAILSVMLFVMAALVVDLGNVRDVRRQSQAAADAYALAGANVLFPTGLCSNNTARPCFADAVAAVKTYASQNFKVSAADWTSCAVTTARPKLAYVPTGVTDCISFDSQTSPTLIRVYLPQRSVQTAFGGLTNTGNVSVRAFAEAKLGTDVKCALCFLGSVSTNNTDFTVQGGSIAVNGNIAAGPNSVWTADATAAIGVAGTLSGGTYTPAATKISPFNDPFAAMVLPLTTSQYTNVARTDPCTDGPGVYSGTVNLPNSSCTLASGIYVVKGAWGMGNNTVLKSAAGGVTLYVTKTGSLDFKNGTTQMSAMTSGATSGFVLLADRDATNDISLQGNGGTEMTGKVYAAGASFSFNGNSCFGFQGGPIVVLNASSVGNKSCLTVTNAVDATLAKNPSWLNQ